MNATQEKFNILKFVGSDRLTVLKEESTQFVCECPVCGGHRLTVSKETGAYQCWSGGCAVALIREAIAPSNRQQPSTPQRSYSKPSKQSKPAPLPERITLARLSSPATDSPQPTMRIDKQHGEVEETTYSYTLDKGKNRIQWADAAKPKGHDKTFVLWHRNSSGKVVAKAGEGICPPYRIDEAITAAKACGANAVAGVEGEKAVEIYRTQAGLACITLSSFSKDELALMAQLLKDAGLAIVYHPDNDQAGINKAVKIKEACDRAGVPFLLINPVFIYPDLPESGDIAEVLAAMEVPEFIRRLEDEIHAGVVGSKSAQNREEQFQVPETPKTGKVPPADIVGREIIEDYHDRLIWNDEHKTWMHYNLERSGVWMPVSEGYLESVIDKILESKNIVGYGSASYVTNVAAKMRRQLFERVWGERPVSEILPFTDGVLELATGHFHKHAPGHRLTWCLPRPYNVVATGWATIKNWFSEATGGNPQHEEKLIHFAAAVLRGRCDLHKFLHLIGIGGSGKSTFTRLLEALIGSQNCWNGSLQDLEDKHSVADLLGKRLVILPDQDKITTGLSNFKRLTGQDSLRGRRLYKDGLNFRFPGMAVVTSNAPIFHSGGGSWLTRRIIMLAFDHKPAANKVRDLEAEFEPELSAFTSHLLSIPNDEITRVLRGVGKDEVNPTLWQANIRTDSIAAWVNEQVIRDPSARTQIGSDRNEWATEQYNPNASTLFGSYSHYCRISGLQAKGKNNFSSDLIELCQQTLGWAVNYDRDGQGRRVICGLRLRTDGDTTPTLDDELTSDNLSDNPSDNPSDNLQANQGKDSDNPDNLLPLKLCGSKNNLEQSQATDQTINQLEIESSDNPAVSHLEIQAEQSSQVVSEVVSESSARLSELAIAPTEPQHPAEVKQSELDFKAPELVQPELGESVQVWLNNEWLEGILLQAPNNHPDPAQRIAGWKVRLLAVELDKYVWDPSHLRPSGDKDKDTIAVEDT